VYRLKDCNMNTSYNFWHHTLTHSSAIKNNVFTRHSLVRAKGEVFVLLCFFGIFVRFFVNDFSTTRWPIHAKFCTRAYSGSGCVFSPLGLAASRGWKRGKLNFRYYSSQWEIFAFWCFLSDISATRGQIHIPHQILYVQEQCLPTCPFSLWGPSAPGGGWRGS